MNNKDYGNENATSSVIYTKLNNYKFLFMGDAGVEVGKISSSKEFIDEINSKYPIISVGKNNRYGHPNNEVLIY